MTAEAKRIVEDFRTLSDPAKREVLAELLRMSRNLDYSDIGDDEMLSAADEVFLLYDRGETEE